MIFKLEDTLEDFRIHYSNECDHLIQMLSSGGGPSIRLSESSGNSQAVYFVENVSQLQTLSAQQQVSEFSLRNEI